MKKKTFLTIFAVVLWLLSGCAETSSNRAHMAEQQALDQQLYEPYKLKNSIEGYEEFIAKYPGNLFVGDAGRQINRLKFDQYLKLDSVTGYREFIQNNPVSPFAEEAARKIEKLEFRRYEKEDTLDGYREFVTRYPKSYHVQDAKLRIQEIEFRILDEELRKNYGFDLLKYRLELRRLKRDLALAGKSELANFTCDARLKDHKGKTYFQTNFIYKDDFEALKLFLPENNEDVFDAVVFEALLHLQSHFRRKGNLEGFSFSLSVSSFGLYEPMNSKSETYFSLESVSQFCQNHIDKETLKERSFDVDPAEAAVKEIQNQRPQPSAAVFSEVSAGLTASEGAFSDTILVLWDPADLWAPATSADMYRIYRSEDLNGNYSPVSGLVKGTMYYDKDIQMGKPYYYKVQGYQKGKAVSFFSIAVPGKTSSGGLKGPIIVQGMPLVEGKYAYKPISRVYPIYQFDKNGGCMENNYQHRLKGRWYYEERSLVVKTGIEDLSYTVNIVEKWEDAFTTHNGRRFHRMGAKQLHHGDDEAMKFFGKGHIRVEGTGLAKRNDSIPLEFTVVLDKAGLWHTKVNYGNESSVTTVPHSQKDFEVAEFNGNYYLAVPDDGPGYFRE